MASVLSLHIFPTLLKLQLGNLVCYIDIELYYWTFTCSNTAFYIIHLPEFAWSSKPSSKFCSTTLVTPTKPSWVTTREERQFTLLTHLNLKQSNPPSLNTIGGRDILYPFTTRDKVYISITLKSSTYFFWYLFVKKVAYVADQWVVFRSYNSWWFRSLQLWNRDAWFFGVHTHARQYCWFNGKWCKRACQVSVTSFSFDAYHHSKYYHA